MGGGKASEVAKRSALTLQMWSGPRSLACVVFWDGSCKRGVCGAGILIKVFMQATIHKERAGVQSKFLDAEIGGCAMLMNSLNQWVDKCTSG